MTFLEGINILHGEAMVFCVAIFKKTQEFLPCRSFRCIDEYGVFSKSLSFEQECYMTWIWNWWKNYNWLILMAHLCGTNSKYENAQQIIRLGMVFVDLVYSVDDQQIKTRMWNMISSPATPIVCLEQKSENFQSRNVTSSMPSTSKK